MEKPWFSQVLGGGDGATGLTREPWDEEKPAKSELALQQVDLNLLDDDFGHATQNTDPLARSTAVRSFGVNTSEGDDALPIF